MWPSQKLRLVICSGFAAHLAQKNLSILLDTPTLGEEDHVEKLIAEMDQALRLPGMLETNSESGPIDREPLEAEVLEAAALAIEELDSFRVREGAAIEAEIRMRAASLRELVRNMEEIRSRALPSFQRRLRERLAELLPKIAVLSQNFP